MHVAIKTILKLTISHVFIIIEAVFFVVCITHLLLIPSIYSEDEDHNAHIKMIVEYHHHEKETSIKSVPLAIDLVSI
jgi:hypothetical protein